MSKTVLLNDLINFLSEDLINVYGNPVGIEIRYVKVPEGVDEFALDWISINRLDKQRIAEHSKARALLVDNEVVYSDALKSQGKVLIVVKNPKLELAKILEEFLVEKDAIQIHPKATIHIAAMIGPAADIGPNVVIGKCKIGKNAKIMANSFIADSVIIGDNVEIHSGVSIGNEAHNFVKNLTGDLIKFPHIGRVIIEDDVVIGANSVISRGVLGDTIIKRGSKIAQLVFIGANNFIGENCAIRPNVMTCGSVYLGKNVILGSSATIREHCRVGNDSIIGMGAVVTKSVPDNEVWFGNPARVKE